MMSWIRPTASSCVRSLTDFFARRDLPSSLLPPPADEDGFEENTAVVVVVVVASIVAGRRRSCLFLLLLLLLPQQQGRRPFVEPGGRRPVPIDLDENVAGAPLPLQRTADGGVVPLDPGQGSLPARASHLRQQRDVPGLRRGHRPAPAARVGRPPFPVPRAEAKDRRVPRDDLDFFQQPGGVLLDGGRHSRGGNGGSRFVSGAANQLVEGASFLPRQRQSAVVVVLVPGFVVRELDRRLEGGVPPVDGDRKIPRPDLPDTRQSSLEQRVVRLRDPARGFRYDPAAVLQRVDGGEIFFPASSSSSSSEGRNERTTRSITTVWCCMALVLLLASAVVAVGVINSRCVKPDTYIHKRYVYMSILADFGTTYSGF
mmetsp:Transcript_19569/g.40355  ORF Transcript_19569/g.40355 Transcript_19569/m.40355 type:complete len:371 (+) Transcript_19569:2716-3828(+)